MNGFATTALACAVLGFLGNATILAYAGARYAAQAFGFGW
ncbi:hypothetical protein C8K44_11976 [Aminobacter sp. AP02]|nr:hypothetical protein C8K44_11976 [Aminobacter sp. AP02]